MMRFSSGRWLSVLAASLFLLSACAVQDSSAPATSQAQQAGQQQLVAYHWVLPKTASGINTPVVLQFTEGRVGVLGLCNTLGASYQLKGQAITIANVVSTMKMCSDSALMEAEQRIARQLPQAATWQISQPEGGAAPQLSLGFAGAEQWVLTGEPTDKTRYGSSPQTLFLEVAPQTASCPDDATQNCLRVRQVFYNEQGLKTGEGQWQWVPDAIQGYRHQAGVRNVLRIKRYEDRRAGAGAQKSIDVLDLMVESERVN